MDIKATRELIAQRIEETGTRAYSFQPDLFAAPCAIVRPGDTIFPTTFDGSVQANFIVALVSGSNADEDSQNLLDEWLTTGHPTSMADAIERAASDSEPNVTVTGWQNYGAVPVAGTRYFAVELLLTVWG